MKAFVNIFLFRCLYLVYNGILLTTEASLSGRSNKMSRAGADKSSAGLTDSSVPKDATFDLQHLFVNSLDLS